MKYYIDEKTKEIFAYEKDGSQDKFIKDDLIPISDEDLAELRKPSPEEIIKEQQTAFNNAIQTHLDTKAKEFRYDNMMSARSYAGYTNPFQAEAKKLAIWASNCWVKAGEIESAVQGGDRDMPSIDEVLAELPVYE